MGGERITLLEIQAMKHRGQKFAMLTAYDYPTAVIAQRAGVHSLLVGDSLGNVLLGHASTRPVQLDLMIPLAEAVRRGAPSVFLIGDIPFECKASGESGMVDAARRFKNEAGCDAVKFEAESADAGIVESITAAGIDVIAHLGLRPQSVLAADGYRAQARDAATIASLVEEARRMTAAGAVMLLIEAVPPEAARAVIEAVSAPVVGCGAGPDCHGHVVVTYDMLGLGAERPPRFVPILANLRETIGDAMRQYVSDVQEHRYPAPEHTYAMRSQPAAGSVTQ